MNKYNLRLASVVWIISFLSFPLPAKTETAAEIDWVQFDGSAEEQLSSEGRPSSCSGVYQQPPMTDTLYWEDPAHAGGIRVSADQATRVIGKETILLGSVSIKDKTRTVDSSRVRLDEISQTAQMEGPIALRDQGLLIAGDKASSNLNTGESTIENASFLLHESRIRGSAEQITRTQEKHLIIQSGLFTRCEPGNPFWSLSGSEMRLKPETGFGHATHVVLRIRGVPVGYIPYIKFPIDDERHTGVLMPTLSWDNEAATDFSLPIYFNIAPSLDATWTPRSLWRRGISNGVQFRFITSQSSNEFNGAILKDDDLYQDQVLIDQTTSGSGPVTDTDKHDRWYINFKHSGGQDRRLKSRLSYNAVSDADYLDDIGGDFGSSAIRQFLEPVESALSERRTPALERIGELDYRGDSWNLLMRAQGFQNLEENSREEYERLPQISFNHKGERDRLESSTRVDLTRFDKDTSLITGKLGIVGNRAVADLSLAAPMRSSWGFFVPKFKVTHRSYRLDNVPAGYEEDIDQSIPAMSLDMGLYFDRYTKNETFVHSLEPRIYFLYVQEKEQMLLPLFDARSLTNSYHQLFRDNRFSGWDRIGDARQASLGLTSRVIRSSSGAELARFDLGQTYYFKDRIVNLPPFLPGVDHTASSSPLFAEVRISPSDNWRLTGSLQWEPGSGVTNKGGLALKYMDDLHRILNISYRYTNSDVERLGNFESIEESDINFMWPLRGSWSLIGKWNYAWDRKQTIESFFGLEYNDCCWRSRLVVRRFLKTPRLVTLLVDDPMSPTGFNSVSTLEERSDTGIFFEIQLKGLGTLGGRLSSLLERAIPGYLKRENQIGQ